MSKLGIAFIILILLLIGETSYIILSKPDTLTLSPDKEKVMRDSMKLLTLKFDSISKAIIIKDQKYDSLSNIKNNVEILYRDRWKYYQGANADTLDSFIRKSW